MKRIMFFLSAFLLAVYGLSLAADTGTAKLIYKRNKIKAYSVVTPDGRRIIVATNTGSDPQKIAAERPRPARYVRRTRNRFLRAVPAGGQRSNTQQPQPGTVPANRTAPVQQQNGIPVCIWHGMLVSPIQVNNTLVCPSENSAYPINP